jgi:hypothetical protein
VPAKYYRGVIRSYFMNLVANGIFHKNIRTRAIISSLYLLAGIIVNFWLLQVYCMPVWWAAICFVLSVCACIAFPFFKSPIAIRAASFFLGVGVFVFAYCHAFLWGLNAMGISAPVAALQILVFYLLCILLLGSGLLAFLPAYFLFHIYKYYRSGVNRRMFWLGLLLPLTATGIYLHGFKRSLSNFKSAYATSPYPYLIVPKLKPDFYTERILGIGIKYHTTLEFVNDGWRPPLHDPLLNISLQFYGNTYFPFPMLDRAKYYKMLFPDKPLRVWCPCSYSRDGKSYFERPPTSK